MLACDECTLVLLSDDGLQRVTQSRLETSPTRTADDLVGWRLRKIGFRLANKSLWYNEQHGADEGKEGTSCVGYSVMRPLVPTVSNLHCIHTFAVIRM